MAERLARRRRHRAVRRRHDRRRQPAAAVPLVPRRRRAGALDDHDRRRRISCSRWPSPTPAATACRSARRERPEIAWYGDMELAPHLGAFLHGGGPSTSWSSGASRSRSIRTDRKRATALAEAVRARASGDSRACAGVGQCRRGELPLALADPFPRRSASATARKRGAIPPTHNRTRLTACVKKVFVKSYGCQMNVYDSERMADVLAREGLQRDRRDGGGGPRHPQHLPHPREGGREGLFGARPRARAEARARGAAGHDTRIVVAGCVAQAEGEEILRRAPAVDVVVGPQSYHRLPELLARAAGERVVDTEFPVEDKFDHLPAAPGQITRAAASRPSSPCRRAATSSAPSASCPIRAARRSRGRWRKILDEARASREAACARSR